MSKGQTKKTREAAGNRRKLTRAEKAHLRFIRRVRRALDLIRPVLIHHVEAVVCISGKCMDHRRFVIRKAAVLFLHFDHPLSVFSLFK